MIETIWDTREMIVIFVLWWIIVAVLLNAGIATVIGLAIYGVFLWLMS